MEVEARVQFYDIPEKITRVPGEDSALFDCTQKRYLEIIDKLGKTALRKVEEPKKEPDAKAKTNTTKRK